MIPAPVTRSATTVPGSGIGFVLTGVGVAYMFVKFRAGVVSGGAVGGTSCTGSGVGAGHATAGTGSTGSTNDGTGDATASGDGWGSTNSGTGDSIGCGASSTWSGATGGGDSTGTSGTFRTGFRTEPGGEVAGDCWVAAPPHTLEKLPGPHTSCAEAGGAAAR